VLHIYIYIYIYIYDISHLRVNRVFQYKTPVSALYGILRRVGRDTDTIVSREGSASIFSVLKEIFLQTFVPVYRSH